MLPSLTKTLSRVSATTFALTLAAGLSTQAFAAAEISGAGATFPAPIYQKWAETYKEKTGTALNYQAIGSGAGIKQIKAETVDFGASDKPLKPEEMKEAGLVQFPAVVGGVVPVVNISGISAGELKLDGPTLAKIFMGQIKSWNDPAIAALNSGAKLPAKDITVVHRSDGSGTTFNFTYYLTAVSDDWKAKVGTNDSPDWPAGVGAKGNDGVAGQVKQTDGAIGYVEYAYAKQNKLAYTLLKNKDGNYPKPELSAFQAAAANADWTKAPGFYLILADQPGKDAWPMTAATFIIMYSKQKKPEQGREVLKFFDWALSNGQKAAEELDFVPLPAALVGQIEASWSQIGDQTAKPVFTK